MKTAIVVLTKQGLELAHKTREALEAAGQVTVLGPSCVVGTCGGPSAERVDSSDSDVFATGAPGVFGWRGPLRKVFPRIWREHDAIVAVMALGIVVRLVGPIASDKRRDPAVVAVDDAGQFAVSVLGGHGAGANRLAQEVARALGAQAVITTASDAHCLPGVDLIGRELGWKIECEQNLTRVAAAVVRGDRVAVWQDAGSSGWWRTFGAWPRHFVRLERWSEWHEDAAEALLVISDRILPAGLPENRIVVYRPPTLVAGIGCKRGTPKEAIERWVSQIFQANGLAEASLAAVATATLKADEPGLVEFAQARGVPLLAFLAEELAAQEGIENPSERVRMKIGIAAVAEPAALRAAGAARLEVAKQIGPGLTLAVARCRREFHQPALSGASGGTRGAPRTAPGPERSQK